MVDLLGEWRALILEQEIVQNAFTALWEGEGFFGAYDMQAVQESEPAACWQVIFHHEGRRFFLPG